MSVSLCLFISVLPLSPSPSPCVFMPLHPSVSVSSAFSCFSLFLPPPSFAAMCISAAVCLCLFLKALYRPQSLTAALYPPRPVFSAAALLKFVGARRQRQQNNKTRAREITAKKTHATGMRKKSLRLAFRSAQTLNIQLALLIYNEGCQMHN